MLLAEVTCFEGFFFPELLRALKGNMHLLFLPLSTNFQGVKNILKDTPGYSVPYMTEALELLSSFFSDMTGKQQALVQIIF